MPVTVGTVLDLIAGKLPQQFKQVDFNIVHLKTHTAVYTASTFNAASSFSFPWTLTCLACVFSLKKDCVCRKPINKRNKCHISIQFAIWLCYFNFIANSFHLTLSSQCYTICCKCTLLESFAVLNICLFFQQWRYSCRT